MAKTTKKPPKEGETPGTDPNSDGNLPEEPEWVSPAQARTRTGLSAQRIRYLGEQEEVKRRKGDKGWEYLLSDLQEFASDSDSKDSELQSLELTHYRASLTRLEEKDRYLNSRLVAMLEFESSERIKLAERSIKHEEERINLIGALEELISAQHARQLEREKQEANIEMRKDALNKAAEVLKPLAQQAFASFFPEAAQTGAILGAVVEVVNRMRPKLEMLVKTDMLTAEEKEMLQGLLDNVPKPPDPEPVETQGEAAS